MKNILVTGGAGYIGSHIVELLVKKNFNVFIIDNLSTGYKKLLNKKAKFFKVDINNYITVKKIIKVNNIDSVIHLAAKLNVSEAEKKPKSYYHNNVTGTQNLILACKKTKVKNFLFSSTCAVYSDKLRYVHENSKKNPKGIYGKTKLMCEKLITKNFKNYKIRYCILRYFNVVGASPSKKIGQISKNGQLFKNLSLSLLSKKPVFNVYGNNYKTLDGTCVRDYIHVRDLSHLHIIALNKINLVGKSIILNCGYGKGLSVLQVIKEFKKYSKKKIKINFMKRRQGDMTEIIANISKLKRNLKWKPKFFSLRKMVKSTVNWEKKLK